MVFSFCTGKNGENGLKGPDGPKGADGPKGEKGADGRDGMDGLPGAKGDKIFIFLEFVFFLCVAEPELFHCAQVRLGLKGRKVPKGTKEIRARMETR